MSCIKDSLDLKPGQESVYVQRQQFDRNRYNPVTMKIQADLLKASLKEEELEKRQIWKSSVIGTAATMAALIGASALFIRAWETCAKRARLSPPRNTVFDRAICARLLGED